MIFLSDGEGRLPETAIQDLCRSAIQYGWVCAAPVQRPLTGRLESSFLFMLLLLAQMGLLALIGEFFSTNTNRPLTGWLYLLSALLSKSYSTLRMMARIAREMQRRAPPDPLTSRIESSFTTALDTVSTHAARAHANKQG